MTRGSDKLSRQIVGRGFFAEVSADVEITTRDAPLRVTFDDACATSFRSAARFGVEYAWEQ
jgi:hypothetical protein